MSFGTTTNTNPITKIPSLIDNTTKPPTLSTPTGNKYYDNIDNKILCTEYEGTIVFEDNTLTPATVHTDTPNDIIIKDLLTTGKFDTIVGLLNEKNLDFVIGMLSDNTFADHTREVVCEIIMAALLSQNEVVVDGAGVCDSLFALLDMDKHDANHIPGPITYYLQQLRE